MAVSRKSPWLTCVEELLADGEWHRFDEVVHEAMAHVPSGKASRRALMNRELTRRRYLERTGQSDTRRQHRAESTDEEQLVRTGRRILVVEAIRGGRHRKHFETQGTGTDRRIRMRPLAKVIAFDRASQREAS